MVQYRCENCRRRFEFGDEIAFCPYCGKPFATTQTAPGVDTRDHSLAQTIDAIWGDEARLRRDFSHLITECIYLVNAYANQSVAMALPDAELSQYAQYYASIKQSNNRKTLLSRVDQFVVSIGEMLDGLCDGVDPDAMQRLDTACHTAEGMIKELYDFLGVDVASSESAAYTIEVLYVKEQLCALYELVLVAYEKYKKCVADNNMFAAFASTSNYGALECPWRGWMFDEEERPAEQSVEMPSYDDVIAYMAQENDKKYCGLLDEDFVSHVDAFWYGLEMLCAFVDNHVRVTCDVAHLRIDAEEQERLGRIVSGTAFAISDARLDALSALKKRWEAAVTADFA